MIKAQAVLPGEIDRLKALTAGDLFLQQRVQTAAGLIAEKAELGQTIVADREKSKNISTVLLMATSEGKTVMDRIRGLLDEMTAMEEARLQQRQAEAQASASQTIGFYMMTVVLSLLFLGFAFNLLEKNHQNRLALMNYSRKLEESNKNLHDFIFVASHDLKEPLRKISSFGDLLKSELGEAITPDAKDYLFKMQDGARRMYGLIEGLIQLTHITTRAKRFEPVDLSVILKEVQSDLSIRLKECGGRMEIGPLPALEADPVQMRQLFQNLLGNALKYRKADTAPVVRVEGEADLKTGQARLWVRDNGMGFNQRDAEKIFNIFQRLHTDEKSEGTGIGLAICRKVVERHNGTITAQSQPGQGATFEITLPLRQKD
jgi:signal transduction histidine kinase